MEKFAKLNFKSIAVSCGYFILYGVPVEQQWVFWLEFNFVQTTP